MRKAITVAADGLSSGYKRSDFGELVRGKYTEQLGASSNVVVIAPEVVELFPNAAAGNAALGSWPRLPSALAPGVADRVESQPMANRHNYVTC
jgi:hypothetical protein